MLRVNPIIVHNPMKLGRLFLSPLSFKLTLLLNHHHQMAILIRPNKIPASDHQILINKRKVK